MDAVLSEEGEDDLADRLRKTLLARRYLLIIDDLWEVNAWDDLRLCFPDARNGSRIILTTRLQKVADYAKHVILPHKLRRFDNEESWVLLQIKVFGKRICPIELRQVGQEIVMKCNGLPFSLVLVAGILSKKEMKLRQPSDWSC